LLTLQLIIVNPVIGKDGNAVILSLLHNKVVKDDGMIGMVVS
jgi:hypothetical protein